MTGAVVTGFGAVWGLRVAGVVGLAAGLLILVALHDRPEAHGLTAPDAAADAPATAQRSVTALQWQVAHDPRIWLLAAASGFFYVTRYAINSWGLFFLQEQKGYDAIEAASLVSINALAGIAGTFFSGFVSDRLFAGRRHGPVLVAGLLFIAATVLFVFGPAVAVVDAAVMVLFGVTMGALLAYLGGMMALDLVDKSAVGTATAIVGLASYLGAAIQDLASGHFIQAGRTMVDGRWHYDFATAGWLWIGAAVLSCVMAQMVWVLPRRVR